MKNNFDCLHFNLDELKKKLVIDKKISRKEFLPNFFKKYFDGFLIYFNIYKKLISSGLIDEWFEEFNYFWKNYLQGRPLYFNDFSFLLGVYRQKFQNIKVKDNPSNQEFNNAWQNSEALYLLFGAVRKYAYEPYSFYRIEKYLKNKAKFLEYGCGIAPISHSILSYSSKKLDIYYADILQINSIYAQYRLKNKANFIELTQKNYDFGSENSFDVIAIRTVLEHMVDPLDCIIHLHKILKPGGYLIFDYIISEGKGLDTIESLNQRKDVIEYISKNFIKIEGSLDHNRSIAFTVVQK